MGSRQILQGVRTSDLLVGALLLLATPLLFFGGPDATSSRLFQSTWSLGHLVLFAALAVVLVRRCPSHWPWAFHWLVTLGITAILGGMAELIQGQLGRTPSFIDWSWDLLGAAIGLVLLRVLPVHRGAAVMLAGVVLGLLGLILAPRVIIALDDATAAQQFPLLASFESPFELTRWRGRDYLKITGDEAYEGTQSLRVTLPPGLYSGTTFAHFPRDWSQFRALEFYAFNPDSDILPITVKIFDHRHVELGFHFHDRYNGRHRLRPGWNRVYIELDRVKNAPRERDMNLQQIRNLQIFTARLKAERTIYLDLVRLIP